MNIDRKRLKHAASERLLQALPPARAAAIDLLRPSLRASWGGPLNGQVARRQIVRDINASVPITRVFETGTFRGTSTEFFSAVFGVPVHTVELHPRFYEYSVRRLSYDPAIEVFCSDSRAFLRKMAEAYPTDTPFIYLDAHWNDDLPLEAELKLISNTWEKVVVMIDDFQVPGDPGYGFDDYGPGKALIPNFLKDFSRFHAFYPTQTSVMETGAKRGCVVLTTGHLLELVEKIPSLCQRDHTDVKG